MKIKITRTKKEKRSEQYQYPILLEWTGGAEETTPTIVLFTSKNTGAKIHSKGIQPFVEDRCVPATDENWIPFRGTLTFDPDSNAD